jgi:hypothetical protein
LAGFELKVSVNEAENGYLPDDSEVEMIFKEESVKSNSAKEDSRECAR